MQRLFPKKPWLLPVLVSLFATLYTFNSEVDEWELTSSLWKALLIGVFASAGIYFVCRKLIKAPENASLVAGLFMIWMYFFEDIRYGVGKLPVLHEIFYRYKFLLPFFAALCFTLILVFRKRKPVHENLIRYFNGLLLVLLIIECGKSGMNLFGVEKESKNQVGRNASTDTSNTSFSGSRPDVFFIVFDSRTSPAALQKYWNYNDSSFVHALTQRGFVVKNNERSNYVSTLYSIASTLNMEYSETLAEKYPHLQKPRLNQKYIAESSVVHHFKKMGYEIHNLSCFTIPYAPKYLDYGLDRPFDLRLWYKSFPGKIFIETNLSIIYAKTGTLTYMKDEFQKIIRRQTKAPVFVYAHFMIPHFPFVYRPDGSSVSLLEALGNNTNEKYLNQLIFTNTVALTLCDSILNATGGNALLIIQGDHGYRFLKEKPLQSEESGCILSAWHFPQGEQKNIYDGMTPVNNFRFVFDSLYQFHFGFLPDKPHTSLKKGESLD